MFAMGSILVGAGALVVGLLALLFRHPRAPRWTRPELVAMLTVIPVTAMLGLGLGYMIAGVYRLLQGVGSLYELSTPVAVAIAVAGLWRLLIGGRLRAYGLAALPASEVGAAAAPAPVVKAAPPALPSARAVQRPAT